MEKNYDLLFNDAFNNKEDLTEFAIAFSEGDDLLKETLLNLWNNNISTYACCKGHDTSEYYIPSYLAIVMDQYSIGLVERICDKLCLEKQDISFEIGNKSENNFNSFSIYMRGNTKDSTLKFINQNASMKPNNNCKILNNCLYMLEYAKSLSLVFSINIYKDTAYLEFRNKDDDNTYVDFKTLDESIESLRDINDKTNLFITCNIDDLDKILDIIKQSNKSKTI